MITSSRDLEETTTFITKRKPLKRRLELQTHDIEVPKIGICQNTDSIRYTTMFFLTGGYFLIEFIWGMASGSLALVADAMHMLSDVIALCIAFYASNASKRPANPVATYGWSRMEHIGALFNGVFLLAMCFSIFTDAIAKFFEEPDERLINNVNALLIVGGIGLGINLLGLLIFGGHGHSHGGGHGGHGGGHGGHGGGHGGHGGGHGGHGGHGGGHGGHGGGHGGHGGKKHGHGKHGGEDGNKEHRHGEHGHGGHNDGHEYNKNENNRHSESSKDDTSHLENRSANTHGVFLHILGDFLGSVAVIISGLVIKYTTWEWRTYVDPLCSLVIALLILCSTVPLLRECVSVLLQNSPSFVDTQKIQFDLLKLPKILEIHEFHVWRLGGSKIVASFHCIMHSNEEFMEAFDSLKKILHSYGIHASTIQPEFIAPGCVVSNNSIQCHDYVCSKNAQGCISKSCCKVSVGKIAPRIDEKIKKNIKKQKDDVEANRRNKYVVSDEKSKQRVCFDKFTTPTKGLLSSSVSPTVSTPTNATLELPSSHTPQTCSATHTRSPPNTRSPQAPYDPIPLLTPPTLSSCTTDGVTQIEIDRNSDAKNLISKFNST